MVGQHDDRAIEQKEQILQLYQDSTSIEVILRKLDLKWKSGDSIADDLDKVLNRYDALMVFFEYLIRKVPEWESARESDKIEFLEKLELLHTDEAGFLDDLANKYRSLEKPFRNYILNRRGTINHLSRISVEGVYYNPDVQTVQAGFSLYTFDSRVLQTKDDIDDFIWLAEGVLEVVIKALKECKNNNSPISQDYINILKERFRSMDEEYQKLQELIESLDSSLDLGNEAFVIDLSDSD